MKKAIRYRRWEISADRRNIHTLMVTLERNLPRLVPSEWKRQVLLAVHEALTNAVVHGSDSRPERVVMLEYIRVPGRVEFRVHDTGTGYAPGSIPDPTLPERLLIPSGRGVYLMNHLVDDFHVVCGEHGCTVNLIKKIPPPIGPQLPAAK